MLPKIQQLLLLGLPNTQVAEALGVGERTLAAWVKRFPAVSAVFASSRELALAGVAKNLFRRANGYSVRRVRREVGQGPNGPVDRTITERVHYPPEVDAAKFILSRRRPDLWPGDSTSLTVGVQVNGLPQDILERARQIAGERDKLKQIEDEQANAS